ncbi:MAG: hypothetical protein JO047_17485 [Alphaproteobacteria bacterium]|nr:hypothetical protein [Alphaproteobacteria bacterium]
MSGVPQVLIETPRAALRSLLPGERSVEAWHQAITAELARNLGPVHAGLFATPIAAAAAFAWTVPGAEIRRYSDLPAESRRALTAAIGSLLSDIRRLAESGAAPAVAAAWPALREVPDYTHVFAVDGRPVLAAWGHVGLAGRPGLFARLDDGLPWRPPPRAPWPRYAAAGGGLMLFALAAGLLLPLLAPWIMAGPNACRIGTDQLALFDEQNRAAERNNELHALLASLQADEGRRRLQCPLPAAAALEPPQVPPPPSQPAALPEQRWEQHDLSMLQGCWHKRTNMSTIDEITNIVRGVQEWTLCFDGHGNGEQTLLWTDGVRCRNALRAEFADEILQFTDAQRCSGDAGRFMRMMSSKCRRVDDSHAACDMLTTEGPNQGRVAEGSFER